MIKKRRFIPSREVRGTPKFFFVFINARQVALA
jgi:hypothetical protein